MDRLFRNWPMGVFFLQMIWIIQIGRPVAKRMYGKSAFVVLMQNRTVWWDNFLQMIWIVQMGRSVAKRTVGNDKFHTHRIWPARADEPLRASITTCLLQIPNMTNHGLAAANSSDTVDTYHAVWSSNWHRRHSLSLGSLKVSLESLVFQLTKWAEESFTRDISRLSGVVRLQ